MRLPEDYRNFLMYVGNGGAGPGYGLYPLPKIDTNLDTDYLKQPFIYTSFTDTTTRNEDEEEYYYGGLEILTFGCCYYTILVVTGEERDKIWFDGYGRLSPVPYSKSDPAHVTFLPWYEQWLDVHIDALRTNKPIQHDWAFGFFS